MDSNKLSQSLFKVIVYFICCRILRQRGKGAEIKAFDKADDIVSAPFYSRSADLRWRNAPPQTV